MTDRISGIILLVTMPILIVFLILVGLAARKQTERLDSYRMLSNHFVDSLRGLTTLKFLGQSRKHVRAYSRSARDIVRYHADARGVSVVLRTGFLYDAVRGICCSKPGLAPH